MKILSFLSWYYSEFNVFWKSYRFTVNRVKNINFKSKLLAEKLVIGDRIEKVEEAEAYITFKDHKEGFPTNCDSVQSTHLNQAASSSSMFIKLIHWSHSVS